MQQTSRNQQYLIIDILILILAVFAIFTLFFIPTVIINRFESVPMLSAILLVIPESIFASITIIVILLSFIGMGIMPILRLLRVNLVQINRSASLVSALIYILGLARSNTENDTGFLGVILAFSNMIAMILLNLLMINHLGLEPIYTMLFIFGTVPISLLSMLYLPFFRKIILSGGGLVTRQTAYISVLSGRLIGAEPRIDPQKPFYIGKRNDAQLVLFDELYVRDDHLCIYYHNNRPMVVAYDNLYLNNQPLQVNVAYPLNSGDELQLGQTKIKFKA